MQGQPALLYLVPFTLGTLVAVAAAQGQLGALWAVDLRPTLKAVEADSPIASSQRLLSA